MADEGLSLRDIKRQERLEKRGGGLGRLPPAFWQQAGALRIQLQQALRECGTGNSSRYIDLHEDLKRLEGLLREITVNRERKLLLAAHEAVSGLRPDLKHLEEREKPLFEDLKRVLSIYRQQVFTGPEPHPATPGVEQEEVSTGMTGSDEPQAKTDDEVPSSREPEPSVEPIDTSESTSPAKPIPPVSGTPTQEVSPQGSGTMMTEARSDDGPPLEEVEQGPDQVLTALDTTDEPLDDTATQLVRVVEDQPPFTGIDARVYTLKAQDVLSLPVFNAQRLAEIGVVVVIDSLDRPSPAKGKPSEKIDTQATKGG